MNIVFDIGNVVVKCSPSVILRRTFGKDCDVEFLRKMLFRNYIWKNLSLGKLTEVEAKEKYVKEFELDRTLVNQFFFHLYNTQEIIEGTVDLIKRLSDAQYPVYALTNNIIENVKYLKSQFDFWYFFIGAIVSAEVQYLKPNKEIYQLLCDRYKLEPNETIFIDDYQPNVDSAISFGLKALQFLSAKQCEEDLRKFGLEF